MLKRLLVGPRITELARLLNHAGLSPFNHAVKAVIKRGTRDSLSVGVDGLEIEGPVASWRVLSQIKARTLEPFETELFQRATKPSMTVLDVGANLGYYTLLAAREVGQSGRVFAFEPDPRTLASLRNNIRRNSFENVTVVPKAASDGANACDFYLSDTASHSGLSRSMDPRSIIGITTVETVAIDDVLGETTVGVIKMDIEGAEPAALRGMQHILARNPSACLFVEFNPAALAAGNSSHAEFLAQLRSLFDEILVIDEQRQQLEPLANGAITGRTNLLCRPRE
jgi:FkbM family methyltransferase